MTSHFSDVSQVPAMRAETWCVDGYPENLNCGFWNMLLLWFELELGVVELEPMPLPPPRGLSEKSCPFAAIWEEHSKFDDDSWSFFVLRKRPPEPRALFKAWRWRDSWRYGCTHTHTKTTNFVTRTSPKLHCTIQNLLKIHTLRLLMSLFWASSLARCFLRRRIAWYCFALTNIGLFSWMLWGNGTLEETKLIISKWGSTCKTNSQSNQD